MQTIEIALACDERYFPGLLGTVASILSSSDINYKYNFHILDGGMQESSLHLLQKTVSRFKTATEIYIIKIDLTRLTSLPSFFFDSYMTYARLLLPELVKVDRLIYIDSDLIVTKDISELWNTDIKGNCCAVCVDIMIQQIKNDCPKYKELQFDGDRPYFNAGLMLIDMNEFIVTRIAEKTFTYLKQNKEHCRFWDQSALNVTLYNLTYWLDNSWDFQAGTSQLKIEAEFNNLKSLNVNIHFIAKEKPWLIFLFDLNSSLYYLLFQELHLSFLYDSVLLKGKQKYLVKKKFARVLLEYYKAKRTREHKRNKNISAELNDLVRYHQKLVDNNQFLKKNKRQVETLRNEWKKRVRNSLLE